MNAIGKGLDYVAQMQDMIYTRRRKRRSKNVLLEPWNTPPEGGQPFDYFNGVPGQGQSGNLVTCTSFTVPNGWDGIAKRVITKYTGTNFVEASDQLIWGVRVDGMFVMNYEAIKVSLGDLQAGKEIMPGIVVKSGQLVEVVCQVDALFVPQNTGIILGGLQGYFYPNGLARTGAIE